MLMDVAILAAGHPSAGEEHKDERTQVSLPSLRPNVPQLVTEVSADCASYSESGVCNVHLYCCATTGGAKSDGVTLPVRKQETKNTASVNSPVEDASRHRTRKSKNCIVKDKLYYTPAGCSWPQKDVGW